MESVPEAVATGSDPRHGQVCPKNDPVATAPGTDLITPLAPLRSQTNRFTQMRTSHRQSQAEVSANAEKAARSQSVKACDSGEFQVALSVHSLN